MQTLNSLMFKPSSGDLSNTRHVLLDAEPCVCVCVYLSVICPYDRCVRWMSVEYETHTQLIPLHRTELPSPLTSGLLFPSLAAAEMIAPPSRPPSFPPPFPSLNRTSGRLKKKLPFVTPHKDCLIVWKSYIVPSG